MPRLNPKDLFRGNGPYRLKAVAAARAMATWDNSDPFAYGRLISEMSQGLILASDVQADADRLLAAREADRRQGETAAIAAAAKLKAHLGLNPSEA